MTKEELNKFVNDIREKIENEQLSKEEIEKLIKKVEEYIEEGEIQSIAFKAVDVKQCPQLFSIKTSFDIEPKEIPDLEWTRFVDEGKVTMCLHMIDNPEFLIKKLNIPDTFIDVELVFDEEPYPGLKEGLQQMIQIYGNSPKTIEKGKKHFREKLKDNYYRRKTMSELKGQFESLHIELLEKYASFFTGTPEQDEIFARIDNEMYKLDEEAERRIEHYNI